MDRLSADFSSVNAHGFPYTPGANSGYDQPDPVSATSELAKAQAKDAHDKSTQVLMGHGDAAGLLAGRRGVTGVDISIETARKDDEEQKQRTDDELFLMLLRNGELDSYIADQIFDGMSDTEITDLVAQIEAETGKSFEDYASDILGDDMPQREPGESDVDYQRRVIKAVAVEIMDEHGRIKPGYEDDPLARRIRREEIYQEVKAFTDRTNAEVGANDTPTERQANDVTNKSLGSYANSEVLGNGLENSHLSNIGTDIQDDSTDAGLSSVSETDSSFADFAPTDIALSDEFNARADGMSEPSPEGPHIAALPPTSPSPFTPV